MEAISLSGGNAGSCHGQSCNMGTLLRHGSKEQKQKYLPRIATGELRLQSMAVTEPTTGTDTTQLRTTAVKKGGRYVVNRQKVWISRIQHSDLMILLARTTPLVDVKRRSEGMSIFIVDLRQSIGQNQDVAFPIADACIETEAANLMRWRACQQFDAGKTPGGEANMAKYLAAKASWEAANVCLQTHGGFGFAHEYDVGRTFRETRLDQVAPISTNLIYSHVAEHLLGLPRSF